MSLKMLYEWYTYVINNYRMYISLHGIFPFQTYCSNNNISYRSIKNWMYCHNIRIFSIQKEVSGVNENKQSPSPVFIPVSAPESSMSKDEHYSNDIITRPDGVWIELMELSLLVLSVKVNNDNVSEKILAEDSTPISAKPSLKERGN